MRKKLIFSEPIYGLRANLKKENLPEFAADQVFNWVYKNKNFEIDTWSNVSKKVKAFLVENYSFDLPKIIWNGLSSDGTRKFLLQLSDKKTVETVLISSGDRRTLCVSSQVGCAIGCTFCHTGTMGFIRHLEAGEVVTQFVSILKWLNETVDSKERITNIVYMGQGEPLHNFDNMKVATEIFLDSKGIGLGQRKITLSTSGLVPQIEKLEQFPPVNIAISLHAAHDDIRSELMPINKVFDLKRLLGAIRKIPLKAHRWITYEYLLIEGLNDGQKDIDSLVVLLDKKESKINLIPFNEYPESKFKRPTKAKILWFMQELNNRGIITTIRATKGQDILAACGQLKSELEKSANIWN